MREARRIFKREFPHTKEEDKHLDKNGYIIPNQNRLIKTKKKVGIIIIIVVNMVEKDIIENAPDQDQAQAEENPTKEKRNTEDIGNDTVELPLKILENEKI